MKYYRGKFMIGIYSLLSEGETLLALCDNIEEFANTTKMTKRSATVVLHRLFINSKKYNHIIFNNKKRKVEFIEIDE